jgi:hypothetical protein
LRQLELLPVLLQVLVQVQKQLQVLVPRPQVLAEQRVLRVLRLYHLLFLLLQPHSYYH